MAASAAARTGSAVCASAGSIAIETITRPDGSTTTGDSRPVSGNGCVPEAHAGQRLQHVVLRDCQFGLLPGLMGLS